MVIKAPGLMGSGGNPCAVNVKNGKIVRIRALHHDEKYSEEELANTKWTIELGGKSISSSNRGVLSYLDYGYKKRVYSPNRILYPLKRVDWEPGGDPNKINPQNRGKSKFKKISFDEATDIMASEIKRIHDKYGLNGVLLIGEDGHHESKYVHQPAGDHKMLFNCIQTGGFTREVRNADSWEGWYWGAMQMYGTQNIGRCPGPSAANIAKHCKMLINYSDKETTQQPGGGNWAKSIRFLKAQGIKFVSITPEVCWTTANHADKWIPVFPGTDAALSLGIMYHWIENDLYDKEYVATHVYGFDEFKDYVMGDGADGIAKTPAWAAEKCGVPEWTIKALATEWASMNTSTITDFGNFMRGPYGHEASRMVIAKLTMQGMGKLGVGNLNAPSISARGTIPMNLRNVCRCRKYTFSDAPQKIVRTQTAPAILDGTSSSWGNTEIYADVEDQFVKYTYPLPAADGGTRIHMIWSEKPCNTACWNDGFRFIRAVRDPSIEFFVSNHMWLENDNLYADLIMPVSTLFEEDDMGFGGNVLWDSPPAIAPLGDVCSDYEIALGVAEKLEQYGGIYTGLYEKCTEGKTVADHKLDMYKTTGLDKTMSYEEFAEKQYVVSPVGATDKYWDGADKGGMLDFYQDPVKNPVATPSGKIEFLSQRLLEHFPDDNERPPLPSWVEGGPASEGWSHDERRGGARSKLYPLLLISNHPHYRSHAQCDDVTWLREIPNHKVKGYDGYLYEAIWINPEDARARRIVTGDIVKVYNERGIILNGAYVTERVRSGAVHQDHGARVDLITDGIDRGGSNNLISPSNGQSRCCWGNATTSFLVEVEKLDPNEMEQWRKQYPEAFARAYNPESGLQIDSWIEEGGD